MSSMIGLRSTGDCLAGSNVGSVKIIITKTSTATSVRLTDTFNLRATSKIQNDKPCKQTKINKNEDESLEDSPALTDVRNCRAVSWKEST